jgi:hypothetical protein
MSRNIIIVLSKPFYVILIYSRLAIFSLCMLAINGSHECPRATLSVLRLHGLQIKDMSCVQELSELPIHHVHI